MARDRRSNFQLRLATRTRERIWLASSAGNAIAAAFWAGGGNLPMQLVHGSLTITTAMFGSGERSERRAEERMMHKYSETMRGQRILGTRHASSRPARSDRAARSTQDRTR